MKIIGLCGASGSGKSLVASYFTELGIPVVDADEIYASITSAPGPCLNELEREFGNGVITEDGKLNREYLRQAVFFSADAENNRKKLNRITHTHVLSVMRERLSSLKESGNDIAVADVPLLFESGFDSECDLTVCVIANRELRIARIINRDGIDRASAERRISAQLSDEVLIANTDYVIRNDSDTEFLKRQVTDIVTAVRTQTLI